MVDPIYGLAYLAALVLNPQHYLWYTVTFLLLFLAELTTACIVTEGVYGAISNGNGHFTSDSAY